MRRPRPLASSPALRHCLDSSPPACQARSPATAQPPLHLPPPPTSPQGQWTVPALLKETDQPLTWLREVLTDIAVQVKRGSLDMWELQQQYKGAAAAAAVAAGGGGGGAIKQE